MAGAVSCCKYSGCCASRFVVRNCVPQESPKFRVTFSGLGFREGVGFREGGF